MNCNISSPLNTDLRKGTSTFQPFNFPSYFNLEMYPSQCKTISVNLVASCRDMVCSKFRSGILTLLALSCASDHLAALHLSYPTASLKMVLMADTASDSWQLRGFICLYEDSGLSVKRLPKCPACWTGKMPHLLPSSLSPRTRMLL